MNFINPYLILGAVGALLVSFLGGGMLGWHERAIRVPEELEAQQTTDQQACAKSQQLTKDANDVLQKDRDTIAARLNALRLQHPPACVRVAKPAVIPASGAEHAGQDGAGTGISSDWLREYAAEAEGYRSQVSVCVDFLKKERETKE